MITEETIARVKTSLQSTKSFLALEVIEDLQKQIEKMKCCENCKYRYTENFPTRTEPCNKCLRYSKWEIR